MNIVFAKHGNSKPFCFVVPDTMVRYIQKDMDVCVDTMHGATMAKTTTGVISGDGAMDIARQSGAYFPLKAVISFLNLEMKRCVQNEVIKAIRDQQYSENIPF